MEDFRPPKNERTLKRGDVREDGLVFVGYFLGYKPNGERWTTKEKFAELKKKKKLREADPKVKEKQRIRQAIRHRERMATDPDYRKKRKENYAKRDRSEYWKRPEVIARRRAREQQYKETRRRYRKNLVLTEEQKTKRAERRNAYRKDRKANDPQFRVIQRLRERVHVALRRKGTEKKCQTMDSIGCSASFVVAYLETRFQPGMTWDNYGTAWHIDHVKPLASFDLSKKSEQLKANHYTNLQPMWAEENLSKGCKVETQQRLACV